MKRRMGFVMLMATLTTASYADITNVVTASLVASVQNTSIGRGNVTVTGPAVQRKVAAKDLLKYLAQDLGGSFPSGAQLALVSTGPSAGYFVVVDRGLNLLADVSGIMSFSVGQNLVYSGKKDNDTGMAAPSQKGQQVANIKFDDTAISNGAQVKFSLQGILTGTVTDTIVRGGGYSESQSATLTSGTGEGTYTGFQLVVTGTMAFRGKVTW